MGIPGVPALLTGNFQAAATVFLTADAPGLSPALLGAQWGLFLGGGPAIVFETFVSIDYRREWAIADYPIERGGFESYNKVQLPFNIHAKFAMGGSAADRAAMLSTIEAASNSLTLFDIVTPEAVYLNVNVQHIDYHRTSTNGVGLLVVEMWLLEIRERVVETSSTNSGTSGQGGTGNNINVDGTTQVSPDLNSTPIVALTNTLSPSGMSPYNAGSISPIPAASAGYFNVLPVN